MGVTGEAMYQCTFPAECHSLGLTRIQLSAILKSSASIFQTQTTYGTHSLIHCTVRKVRVICCTVRKVRVICCTVYKARVICYTVRKLRVICCTVRTICTQFVQYVPHYVPRTACTYNMYSESTVHTV